MFFIVVAGAFLLWVRGRVFFVAAGAGARFFLLRVRGAHFFFLLRVRGRVFFVAGAVGAPFFLLRVRSVFAVFSIFYYENLYFL